MKLFPIPTPPPPRPVFFFFSLFNLNFLLNYSSPNLTQPNLLSTFALYLLPTNNLLCDLVKMSRRNRRGGNQEVELKLNLAAPVRGRVEESSSPSPSPPRSCVSSEDSLKYSSSPEATSMVLVGCPRCLMYVMLSEADPRCPKCKSTVLLDFLRNNHHHHHGSTTSNHRRGRN